MRLKKWPTRTQSVYKSKRHYRELLTEHVERLNALQSRHYAANRYALLLILQAMDTAGKDGVIKHVLSGVNPQGVQVFSFKRPSPTELAHDFLWRTTIALPERGRIGIFNRSYYEEVLVVRVHPEILDSQNLPPELMGGDVWKQRFESIRDLEKHLFRNGTRIVKFYLHLSKEEQRKRLLERIDDPDKQWKFSAGDIEERNRWDDYLKAYEQCLAATTSRHAPWYVVPADDKRNARLIVSQVILDHLQALNPRFPGMTASQKRQLQAMRRVLARESP